MKKFYVYIHTCKANGKKYVGVTTKIKPEYRWGKNGEGYLYNDHFRSAILKHGWNNFQHEVFEVESEEEMYRKEIELISFYHSNDPRYGYNNSTGGEHSKKGCKATPDQRKANSERQKGKILSPETRSKISATLKGRVSNRKGCTESEEQKRKISKSLKGKPFSEEHREHLAEANRRTANDPERVRKLSEAQKERWSDSEYKEKMSKIRKERCSDPEYRKKLSEAKKGKPQPKVKISLPDGTILEITKQNLSRHYIKKGKKFEYVS